jgi:hypothetical protein
MVLVRGQVNDRLWGKELSNPIFVTRMNYLIYTLLNITGFFRRSVGRPHVAVMRKRAGLDIRTACEWGAANIISL